MVLTFLYACNNGSAPKKESKEKEDYHELAEASTECLAPADWFNTTTGTRITPAPNEGPTSVFANNKTVTNCDFHQWSWQKFLWLTNEENGVPTFMNLIQVQPNGDLIQRGGPVMLSETAQASSSTDVLKTPNYASGTPPQTTVYYSISMNELMFSTMNKYASMASADPSSVKGIAFPVGAFEVKTSWIDVAGLSDTSSYFITNGVINGTKARVALLGMHVVGVVENHPEFVWATFEHENLAPAYDWGQATPTSDAPVTSSSDYPFFDKSQTATVKNITSGNGVYSNIFSVYQYGVPVQKMMKGSHNVQVFMETSQDGSQNFNNIRTINASVKSQLTGVWNSYIYNGSIWINTEGYEKGADQIALLDSLGYNLSNSKPGDLTRGSVAAYNITMETYVQVGFNPSSIHGTDVSNLANCLSCHNAYDTKEARSPLYISHVFSGKVKSLQGKTPKEIKKIHVDQIRAQFAMRASDKKE